MLKVTIKGQTLDNEIIKVANTSDVPIKKGSLILSPIRFVCLLHLPIYIHTYTHTHIHIHIYTYIYTYTKYVKKNIC